MIIVIQCCSRKKQNAGSFIINNRQTVRFVAEPDLCQESDQEYFCKPDDLVPGSHNTWREHLQQYNEIYHRTGDNPYNLCTAIELYRPKGRIYRALVDTFGEENTFILSAGWGLVGISILLPDYDITFSKSAKNVGICRVRSITDNSWNDFNHLKNDHISENEVIYFFGGLVYHHQFYKLMTNIPNQKVIYYNSQNYINHTDTSYRFERYHLANGLRTNWHYQCAKDFMHQRETCEAKFTTSERESLDDRK